MKIESGLSVADGCLSDASSCQTLYAVRLEELVILQRLRSKLVSEDPDGMMEGLAACARMGTSKHLKLISSSYSVWLLGLPDPPTQKSKVTDTSTLR